MGFSLSPSVTVTETDLTLYIPNVATSIGALVGFAEWGAVEEVITVSSEKTFVGVFGQPNDNNFKDWYTAYNFLAYSKNLKFVRVVDDAVALNAGAGVGSDITENQSDFVFDNAGSTITTTAGTFVTSGFVVGGSFIVSGSSLNDKVFTINTVTETVITVNETVIDETPAVAVLLTQYSGTFDSTNSSGILIKNSIDRDANEATIIADTNAVIAKYPGIIGNDLKVSIADASSAGSATWPDGAGTDIWAYTDFFNIDPVGDEIYAVVLLNGNVVETFEASKDSLSKNTVTGGTNFIKEIVNRQSKYVWLVTENLYAGDATNGFTNVQFEGNLSGALDGYADTATSDDERMRGWDLLTDAETLDINLCMAGGASVIAGKYMIENVAEWRKDCVGFVSPMSEDVVGSLTPVTDITTTRDLYGSSSYAFMDGNYKYQYDAYNDKFYWVPFNGDMAGLCANTDEVEDPWWSPAGLNRGSVKNVTKLAFNPTKTNRDNLYRRAVNPVVIFRGEGTILFGDKTLQTKPSAFDRINVRRLFIVIEKAIATASKYALFEFNDSATRQAFVSLVEPYLRDVKARRGIYDFKVVCDETNNTPVVIDRNEFIGDIYIKPTRSINFIYLNFVAVPTGVEFEEILLNQ